MKKIMELLQNMKAKNEKKDNKGFSLVELIIVIAIMAILVGIVGTQVIPYINKSKAEKDRQLVNSYSTAAVSAYSMVAGELSNAADNTLDIYTGTPAADSTEAKIVAQVKELTYSTWNDVKDKFKSKDAKNATDVEVVINPTTHKVTATLKGADGAANLTVESDL